MFKIFGTDGVRCKVNVEPMTPDTCLKIAKTVGHLLTLKNKKKNRVIISKDTRLSGYLFEPLMTSGFISMGMDVIIVGPLPTPALPMLINSLRADIGVMITASHNTYEYNGLKFFDSKGRKISRKLEIAIEKIVLNKKKYLEISNKSYNTGKAKRLEDAQGRYSESLKLSLHKTTNFKNTRVVLDCGNGATYKIAPTLFWELGSDVITINNEPNGKNINKNCGAVNVNMLSKKVLETKSDIGFAFDGDGDRIIVVDNEGNEIDGDQIMALFAKIFKENKTLSNKTVVATKMSNLGFEKYLKNELDINLIRTDVGDINVIEEMIKKSYNLGGEQSGHIILGDYNNTGDGILVALKIMEILIKSNKKSNKLFNNFKPYFQIKENLILNNIIKDKQKTSIKLLNNNYIKNKKHLRCLIRESGTEPLLRILVEGKNQIEVNKEIKLIKNKLENILND